MRPETIKSVKDRINSYGNVDSPPKGWKPYFGRKNAIIEAAEQEGKAVKAVTGWKGTTRYPKPELRWYVYPSIAETLHEKAKALEQRREKANQNRLAKQKKRTDDAIANAAPQHAEIISVDVETYELLERYLDDINEAHPDWLSDAVDAVSYSIRHDGIMSAWKRDPDPESFYRCVCKAIAAWRRHNWTDYEEMLAKGVHRDNAQWLANDRVREIAATETETGRH